MLSRAAKEELVKEFNQTFQGRPSVFVVGFKGLSVKQMESLRGKLRGEKTQLKVVKNTLLKLASHNTGLEKIQDLFSGSTAVAICGGEPIAVAKIFAQASKEFPLLEVKGGLLEGEPFTAGDIEAISKLPSRNALLSQFVGLLSSPMSNLVWTLSSMQSKLLDVLTALKDKKERG